MASFREKCKATHSSLVSRGSDRPSSKDAKDQRQLSSSHSQKSGVSTKEKLGKAKQESDLEEDEEDLEAAEKEDLVAAKADK